MTCKRGVGGGLGAAPWLSGGTAWQVAGPPRGPRTHHPIGDDQPGGFRAAGKKAKRVSAVHDQCLLLSHLGQVGHCQPELPENEVQGW